MKTKRIFILIFIISFVFLISCNQNNFSIDEKSQQKLASEYLGSKYSDDFAFLSSKEGDLTELAFNSDLGQFTVKIDNNTKTLTDNYLSLYYKQEAEKFFLDILKPIYGEKVKVVVDTSDVFFGNNSFSKPENLKEYLFYSNVINFEIFTSSSSQTKEEDIEILREKLKEEKVRMSADIYYLSDEEFENCDYSNFSNLPNGRFKTDIDINFSDYIWY